MVLRITNGFQVPFKVGVLPLLLWLLGRVAAPMNYTFVVFIKSAITWLKGCMIQDVSVLDTKANNSLNKQH